MSFAVAFRRLPAPVLVGCGGAVGTALRYAISLVIGTPLGIFFISIVGAFILG